jgi:hypothetical protein
MIDTGFGVRMEKPEIEEFLNGNCWWNNMTRTKRRRVSDLLGLTRDLETCLLIYSVDDGCSGCLQTSLELESREHTVQWNVLLSICS